MGGNEQKWCYNMCIGGVVVELSCYLLGDGGRFISVGKLIFLIVIFG